MRCVLTLLIMFFLPACVSTFTTTQSHYQPNYPADLEYRINKEKPNDRQDHFAVLLGANTELRHKGSMSLAYQTLIESGYKRKNIYILDPDGQTPIYPVSDTTSRVAIKLLFNHLKNIVEPQDTILIYVSGHGQLINQKQNIILNPGETMEAKEFILMVSQLYPLVGIMIADQCYWSVDYSPQDCAWASISVSTPNTTSFGTGFPRAFWWSIRRGNNINYAFEMAKKNDYGTKTKANNPKIFFGNCLDKNRLNILGGNNQ